MSIGVVVLLVLEVVVWSQLLLSATTGVAVAVHLAAPVSTGVQLAAPVSTAAHLPARASTAGTTGTGCKLNTVRSCCCCCLSRQILLLFGCLSSLLATSLNLEVM